ncbi:NADH dehydrogenase [Halobiforma nitratireducens]|uniref:Respiratory-chain NADH dehydrogenase domain 51 kDa subunit n=1 Tax=Halobiforma nitratireducens JCM 10879 TaxID=1227454 RepID=M0M971_9EURY|nr:NADH dehydrogenase [Halobiforma nitratireducens]EMA41169.1 respiratory-chain NADH dehydrogenase domain 51 kDa subunit [Halobiforma nitratireducens JCM 10879]
MSVPKEQVRQFEVPEFAVTLRNAGVAGAGGAGFPSYAKWDRLEEVDALLVNHQESEPNYYMDKWLGRERTDELVALFDGLLESALDRIVVATKETDRQEWVEPLEEATDATVYEPAALPVDEDDTGVVVAYTDDRYEYGMESVLMRLVAGVVMEGEELPMDHGWIVQNTETLWNVFQALTDGDPMTRKFVHVDGRVPQHRFLEVPVGTPATELLAAAGRTDGLDSNEVLLDGGPGWCFEIDREPDRFGVRKRTNCLLVMEESVVAENRLGGGRVNVLAPAAWKESTQETEPTETLRPDYVELPRITNPALEGIVTPSEPIVRPDDEVETGEMVARPGEGISIAQHAPVDGTVSEIDGGTIRLDASGREATAAADEHRIYWTWCGDCGRYLPEPQLTALDTDTFVCARCR